MSLKCEDFPMEFPSSSSLSKFSLEFPTLKSLNSTMVDGNVSLKD